MNKKTIVILISLLIAFLLAFFFIKQRKKTISGINDFPCSSCGLCCKNIRQTVLELNQKDQNSMFYFPYGWDQSGACEMLKDNKCSIYDNRPLVCNIAALQKISGFPKETFYKICAENCNSLIDNSGLSENFKVKI